MTLDDQDINFTPRSQKLLQLCKKIALDLNYTDVTTAHLFAAFFELRKSRCIEILAESGLDLKSFKVHLYSTVLVKQPPKAKKNKFRLSPEVKHIISDATELAKDLNHSWVSAEHIFLALFKDRDLIPDEIMVFLGVDLNFVTTKVLNYLCDSEERVDGTLGGEVRDLISPAGGAQNFPFLEKFASNMVRRGLDGKLDPVFGRDVEIAKLEDILNRRKKNNAIIVGAAGVGKTAIVEGLVQNIILNKSSFFLNDKIIYELNLSSLIAGTKYRGEFEARIKQIVEEAKESPIILFIDEIHTLIGAGDAEGGLDAANILKPALSTGEITVIGATTFKEYRQKFGKDKALQRRFQPLIIDEPSKKSTLEILTRKKAIYEDYHSVQISEELLDDIVNYSERYITDAQFPDKAIDLMDLACSHVKVSKVIKPQKMKGLEDKLVNSFMVKSNTFQNMEDDQIALFESLKKSVSDWTARLNKNKIKLTRRHLFEVLASKTNIPIGEFLKSDVKRYLGLEKVLKKRIVGQDPSVETICKCLLRHKSGLRDTRKPIGSFLFLGTTGVGKTYLGKMLADSFFATPENFIHLDMSEFSEESSVSKLIGSSPGYIGHENGGLLVEKITKNPHSVVMFDEVEKAHPKIHQMLLQILDEGRLTDAQGRVGTFHNAIIIVTGNIGSRELGKSESLGFGATVTDESNVKDALKEVKKILPPELLNRFDDILFFNRLTDNNLKTIIKHTLTELKGGASQNGIVLNFSRNISDFIFNKINQKEFGARMVKRIVQKEISDVVSEEILKNGDVVEFNINYQKKSDKICVDF